MAATLKLEIVTPDEVAFAGEVEMVTLPGIEGQLGVYPGHVPLVTQIVPGEVIARQAGREYYLVVGEGFAEITPRYVAILSDMAVGGDTLDEAKAQEARRKAEARMAERMSAAEVASVSAAIAHSIAQLRLRRRGPR
ncbi:MAG: ATP synthase F1 subunit epsilon [Verrucomicrobiae bacterium]|nr:ATP synthase F1 subunit epsilon [Verrucomicrobiae bacterium]MCX7722742.1 ATP synthase F1 subunit epsilon [Verrucomicrobiae bacterium]MDW7981143.1 ATP synthase F1 subunit epsilon [Verrucomicrobiales bacterium]